MENPVLSPPRPQVPTQVLAPSQTGLSVVGQVQPDQQLHDGTATAFPAFQAQNSRAPELSTEPQAKKARVGSQQTTRHRDECQVPGTMYLPVHHLCVRPEIDRLPRLVSWLSESLRDHIPKQIRLDDFKRMMLSSALYNLYYKVDRWTAPIRLGYQLTPVVYQSLPSILTKALAAYQPILSKDTGIQVSLYPHLEHMHMQIVQMCADLGLPNPVNDPTLILRWMTVVPQVTKSLGHDIFTSDTQTKFSFLDSGVVEERERNRQDRQQDEEAEGPGPEEDEFRAFRVVSTRQLTRSEELITAVIQPRIYQEKQDEFFNTWYIPEVLQEERASAPLLTAYYVSGRPAGKKDFLIEIVQLMIMRPKGH